MSIINTHITLFPPFSSQLFPLPSTTPLSSLLTHLHSRLPSLAPLQSRLLLSTTSGTPLSLSSPAPLSTLLNAPSNLLTLRLTPPLCGGKGGFGSQLRAAGGRMSSRKKSQENSDSCRNLSGRRLRTVKEAKALAEWLEVRPEMERKEREEKMKRWREIVEKAERREGMMTEGGGEGNNGGLAGRFEDAVWMGEKEEGREKVAEAVREVMRRVKEEGLGDEVVVEMEVVDEDEEEEEEGGMGSSGESSGEEREREKMRVDLGGLRKVEEVKKEVKKLQGWDEEDEFMSSDEEEEEEVQGKGKAVFE